VVAGGSGDGGSRSTTSRGTGAFWRGACDRASGTRPRVDARGARPVRPPVHVSLTGEIIDSAALLDDRGRVYFGSGDGTLYARDAATGAPVWTFAADPPSVTGAFINWFEGNVAMGDDGTLYVPNDNFLTYAIDRDTTEVRWRFRTQDQTWSLPAVNPADRRLFLGNNFQLFVPNTFALDAATGVPVWHAAVSGSVAASPMLTADGKILVGGFDGFLRCYDQATGVPCWSFGARDHIYASPAQLPDGTIVQPSADGTVYGLDPRLRRVALAVRHARRDPIVARHRRRRQRLRRLGRRPAVRAQSGRHAALVDAPDRRSPRRPERVAGARAGRDPRRGGERRRVQRPVRLVPPPRCRRRRSVPARPGRGPSRRRRLPLVDHAVRQRARRAARRDRSQPADDLLAVRAPRRRHPARADRHHERAGRARSAGPRPGRGLGRSEVPHGDPRRTPRRPRGRPAPRDGDGQLPDEPVTRRPAVHRRQRGRLVQRAGGRHRASRGRGGRAPAAGPDVTRGSGGHLGDIAHRRAAADHPAELQPDRLRLDPLPGWARRGGRRGTRGRLGGRRAARSRGEPVRKSIRPRVSSSRSR